MSMTKSDQFPTPQDLLNEARYFWAQDNERNSAEIAALKVQLREAVRLLSAGLDIKSIEHLNEIESAEAAFLAKHADIVKELAALAKAKETPCP